MITVADASALCVRVEAAGLIAYLPLEERWYRRDQVEDGYRQFGVADPDGYRLRFFTYLGPRRVQA